MFNVSFGARVPFIPTKPINKARASEIAQAINSAFNTSDIPRVRPSRPVSGASLEKINFDCFDKKTHTLNEKGLKDFDILNKDLGISVSSKLSEYVKAIRDYVQKFNYEGEVSRNFDQIKYK